jgi:hypothetical protein
MHQAKLGIDSTGIATTPETSSPEHQTTSKHPLLKTSAVLTLPSAQNASNPPKVPEALTSAQAKRLTGWGARHQGLIQRCWTGKASPREAIKAMCNDCVGEDHEAITECGDRCCPLWRHRPYQSRGISAKA